MLIALNALHMYEISITGKYIPYIHPMCTDIVDMTSFLKLVVCLHIMTVIFYAQFSLYVTPIRIDSFNQLLIIELIILIFYYFFLFSDGKFRTLVTSRFYSLWLREEVHIKSTFLVRHVIIFQKPQNGERPKILQQLN